MLKVAVTCWLALSVTTQGPVPLHPAPLHPAKDEPVSDFALRVTEVPKAKLALQAWPQLIPGGMLVTLPVPVPLRATVSAGVGVVEALKLAITEVFCVRVTLQSPVPVQAPDHPANKEFAIGDAVSVTCVPLENLAVQDWPQLMPAGLLLTVPAPGPAAWTVS
jgi:hypothetical protein